MNKDQWKRALLKQTKKLNTYQDAFKPVIETLAVILEERDNTFEEFEASGEGCVVEHISDRGATNMKKNPRLQVWMDLNTQALTYWRELGLTPAGFKRLNDTIASKDEATNLEKALNGIAKELGKGT